LEQTPRSLASSTRSCCARRRSRIPTVLSMFGRPIRSWVSSGRSFRRPIWRDQNRVFEHISGWRTWFYRLSGIDEPEQVWGVRTSANFFNVLGVEPLIGRTFLPEEEQPGRDRVVLISHGLWERRFGADPGVVGQTI